MSTILPIRFAPAVFACLLLASCGEAPVRETTPDEAAAAATRAPAGSLPAILRKDIRDLDMQALELPGENEPQQPPLEAQVVRGSGTFVHRLSSEVPEEPVAGEITLNFENTDIREVVKVILGDLLGESYVLDPRVSGGATIQTGRPLTREALLPTLETLLHMNGAALVRVEGIYHVVPSAEAARGLQTPGLGIDPADLPTGFTVQVVPLHYIGAKEMQGILEPLASQGAIIRVDTPRNLLVLAGTAAELRSLIDTIRIFDVDWLAGMSVGFFPLQNFEAATVASELDAILGAEGPLAGLVRVAPMEQLNGLLVVTSQPKYLDDAERWIERLDRFGLAGGAEERLFVYRVQNGKAEQLASILDEVFSGRAKREAPSARVAPGRQPVTLESRPGGEKEAPARRTTSIAAQVAGGGEVRIIADEENNALVILARPADYEKIESALRRLDVPPLQVLVEASIVEVSLEGDFSYGVQWAWRNEFANGKEGVGIVGLAPLETASSSFSYVISKGDELRARLNILESQGKARTISSPSLLVLDNQTASINVGNSVSVQTGASTSSVGGATTSNFQFRDTGVTLEVTPRVNAGGLVIMEVSEDVSNVNEAIVGAGDNPTIAQRTIQTTVAVQSGDTIALGGLIEERGSAGESGVPWVRKVPGLGFFFGQTNSSKDRRELLVLITPRAVRHRTEALRVTEELRNKLQGLRDMI
jgi:general secretion pathway protein D